ncbi:MAG: hypothetical protein ACKVQA_05280 [Burkholderiales bacterium]
MGTQDRVAVIAVHGIADQEPGQTVRELARLLCHGAGGKPRFVQGEVQRVLVPVVKLEPGDAAALMPRSGAGAAGPSPEPARKRPGTPSGFYQDQKNAPPEDRAQPEGPKDLSAALNDYLLSRLEMPEHDALYESTRISMRRRAGNQAADIFELYWADLSRLRSGGMRALSALYQLFFHLSTLAAGVVDQVALSTGGGPAWRALQSLHSWLAWLMKSPAAILQLSMLLAAVFGALAFVPAEQQGNLVVVFFGTAAVALGIVAAMAWLHGRSPRTRWIKVLVLALAAAASLAAAIFVQREEARFAMIYFGASALATALTGAWLIERYSRVTHGVRVPGHVLVASAVLLLCIEGWRFLPYVTTQFEWMLGAALHAAEWLLAALLLVWALFVLVQTAALLLGLWLGLTGDASIRASLHTARLAMVASNALFTLLSLLLWSVIAYAAGLALSGLSYEPIIFGEGYRSAEIFLQGRVQSLGVYFTPLALAFVGLGAIGLLVLSPSLLEEISPTVNLDSSGVREEASVWAQRLGAWTSGGMRGLGSVLSVLVPVGAIAGGLLYLAFVFLQFASTTGMAGELANWLARRLEIFQGETLVAAGKWLAGGTLALTALGAHFRQTLGRLRVALDAVLDVDNYFGDPRNRQPPRARIFSRLASLLSYLRDSGYTRVVLVAHSQGTVICADLLRYLNVQGRLKDIMGAMPVALVTAGSPLRDLYAARFPLLYEWVGSNEQGFHSATPAVAALGVTEWVNTYRSGDYVGRALWISPDDPTRFRVAALGSDGAPEAQRANDRTEFCLGSGGHTHYFDNDAVALAAEIDRLIAG